MWKCCCVDFLLFSHIWNCQLLNLPSSWCFPLLSLFCWRPSRKHSVSSMAAFQVRIWVCPWNPVNRVKQPAVRISWQVLKKGCWFWSVSNVWWEETRVSAGNRVCHNIRASPSVHAPSSPSSPPSAASFAFPSSLRVSSCLGCVTADEVSFSTLWLQILLQNALFLCAAFSRVSLVFLGEKLTETLSALGSFSHSRRPRG